MVYKKVKFDYDDENDILYVYTGDKAKESVSVGDVVIDLSEGKIVGVEILDARKKLEKELELVEKVVEWKKK